MESKNKHSRAFTLLYFLLLAFIVASCAPSRRACEKNYGPCGEVVERVETREKLVKIPGDTVRLRIRVPPEFRFDTIKEPFFVKDTQILWRSPTVVPGKGAASIRYEWQGARLLVECSCDTTIKVEYQDRIQTKIERVESSEGFSIWQAAGAAIIAFFLGLLMAALLRK